VVRVRATRLGLLGGSAASSLPLGRRPVAARRTCQADAAGSARLRSATALRGGPARRDGLRARPPTPSAVTAGRLA
jgi:hypothetical protein